MRILPALAAMLLVAAPPAAAQAEDTARVGAVLAEVCPGVRVRLHGAAGGTVQGRCGPVLDGRLVVTDDAARRALPLASVREVWVHERQTRRGATIGAGVGAGTLVLAGVLFVNLACYSSDCTRDYLLAIQYGTLIGGGAGALLGAGIGYLSRDWERRYP
jgi:hypothetical protein